MMREAYSMELTSTINSIEIQEQWGDSQLYTLAHAYELMLHGEREWTALGNFMNDFFHYFVDQRQVLLDEPVKEPEIASLEQHRWAVFCAASAEHLATTYSLLVPAWAQEPSLACLTERWYLSPRALKNEAVRAYYDESTPRAFTRRNIFCGERVFLYKTERPQSLPKIA
ncbi:hypothetical protein [Ktedonospora formicarum]|uniref:Uncharacterized protein n=1 Tax=Ktedonospora formicarum TaxID=2778364 RepID=A0A8J3MW76_9CHLR|nr:hypothetical protein [Ktedonospora formicarum]GHO48388.1 hypothetical protein KSX_65510 [Ktedonospora formicarum]